MKYIILISLVFPAMLSLQGQVCGSFQDFESAGNDISQLDSMYRTAMHAEPALAVFHGREQEFLNAWKQLQIDLAEYLAKNDFVWEQPVRCFNRVYFQKSGRIDYFLFNFRPGEVAEDKQSRFRDLLADFIRNHTLAIESPANAKFSQCGPVRYSDVPR